MDHVITHIVEPERLLLRWQPRTGETPEERTHWVVGYLRKWRSHGGVSLNLEYAATSDFDNARKLGFQGYPAFPLSHTAHGIVDLNAGDERVFRPLLDVFMKRLPPRSRGDFGEYLKFHCLPADAEISDFALLGYTGAKLPSDGFSFLHPFDDKIGPCEFRMEVAGWRHHSRAGRLRERSEIRFEPEPANRHDPEAVRVIGDGDVVGHVPRGLTAAFHLWLRKSELAAEVHTLPVPEGPPELSVFVTVRRRG